MQTAKTATSLTRRALAERDDHAECHESRARIGDASHGEPADFPREPDRSCRKARARAALALLRSHDQHDGEPDERKGEQYEAGRHAQIAHQAHIPDGRRPLTCEQNSERRKQHDQRDDAEHFLR